MKTAIFELLRSRGYLRRNAINERALERASHVELIDLANELTENTEVDLQRSRTATAANSAFNFSSAISLSGGGYPCRDLECREQNARQLAQFAALYGDRIYIRNYFNDYRNYDFGKLRPADIEDDLRHDMSNDLRLLLLLEPLILEGKIVVYSTPDYCLVCDEKRGLSKQSRIKYNRARTRLEKVYLDSITASANKLGNEYWIEVQAPEHLLEHGFIALSRKQMPFNAKSKLMQQLHAGNKVLLSKPQLNKIDITRSLVRNIMHDIPVQVATSQIFNASFLTENELQIDILNNLSVNREGVASNQIVRKYLSTLVPYVSDVDIKELVKLRKREEDSFILFRSGLDKAISEYRSNSRQINQKTASQIYSDIIAPKLAKLDLKVASAKRDLIKTSYRKALGLVGSISFGIYSGYVSSELTALASAFGLAKYGAEFIQSVMKKSDYAEEIKNDEMYFLWQLRKLSK